MKVKIKPITIGLVILQLATFLLGTTIAASGTTGPNSNEQYVSNQRANVLKILSVLENKIEDQQLLQKAKGKLLTLGDRQTQLIASLSDRIAKGGSTIGSDIAFLLMTALITLL
jgi:hypothetical protein